ncbi:pyridoxal 5'-phosphate synthase glutaminase subunit PdxT [Thermicanus aegyptius]|uniref:pyridoxal 5'-phosphate synthase glutaminase subunit PdxT n=1 Tax=Thermicanus aegyptius TaxID=94009 RepID=UPI0003FE62E6|nr:pyridoxal 5'-phosphate synthase glutaminase subunit PdxT [Thermicanus aegyptius]
MKVGVLALQGAVSEHVGALQASGAEAVVVKKTEQLNDLDGLILPGGESTTMGRLMNLYGFVEKIKEFHQEGKPIFGTCAGLILLAKEIRGEGKNHLGLMNIQVERNAFGRQRESFETELMLPGVANHFLAVFIRAPYVTEVRGEARVLGKYQDKIVAVEEGTLLATAFHPELTEDYRLHRYFLQKVKEAKERRTQ